MCGSGPAVDSQKTKANQMRKAEEENTSLPTRALSKKKPQTNPKPNQNPPPKTQQTPTPPKKKTTKKPNPKQRADAAHPLSKAAAAEINWAQMKTLMRADKNGLKED